MESNQKFVFAIVLLACLTLCVVVWAGAWANVNGWRALTSHGYSEVRDPGTSVTRWVAPGGPPSPNAEQEQSK